MTPSTLVHHPLHAMLCRAPACQHATYSWNAATYVCVCVCAPKYVVLIMQMLLRNTQVRSPQIKRHLLPRHGRGGGGGVIYKTGRNPLFGVGFALLLLAATTTTTHLKEILCEKKNLCYRYSRQGEPSLQEKDVIFFQSIPENEKRKNKYRRPPPPE